jgi:serine/threonine protein kinase
LKNTRLKLTDFGASKIIEGTINTNTIAGSLTYMSPEIALGAKSKKYNPFQSDGNIIKLNGKFYHFSVFSFGIIIHEMITGMITSRERVSGCCQRYFTSTF